MLPSDVSVELTLLSPATEASVADGISKARLLKVSQCLLPIFVSSGIIDFSTKVPVTQNFDLMAQILKWLNSVL